MITLNKLITVTILLMSMAAFSQDAGQDYPCNTELYLKRTPSEWQKSVEEKRSSMSADPAPEEKFNFLMEVYGLMYSTMESRDEDLFKQYEEEAENLAEELILSGYRTAESRAILSSITGLKIGYAPFKGMWLGPKAQKLIGEAVMSNPESALVQHIYANNQYFTPKMWGGSPENAITAYRKAIELYELEGKKDCWLYLDAHAWLGIVLEEEEQEEEAREVWSYIVDWSPEFKWVKEELLPSLNKVIIDN